MKPARVKPGEREQGGGQVGRPGAGACAARVRNVRLIALSSLTLLLAACYQPSSPATPIPTPIPAASLLRDQNVALGPNLSVAVQQAFAGSWEVQGLPAWLTASPMSGTGNLNTTLFASRSASVSTAASQPMLGSDVKVKWTATDGTGGSVTLKVSADLYALTGRVQDSASSLSLSATDLGTSGTAGVRAATPAARGVIVGYRSQASRLQAMKTLSTGGLETALPGVALKSAAGQVLTLSTPDVQGTIDRLKARPDVAYAVPDATLSALDLGQPVQAVTGQPVTGQAVSPQQLLSPPLNSGDDFAPLQWAFRLLGYPAVWRDMQQNPYTRAVTVAVLDTGVRYDHPDLKGHLYGPGDGALDVLSYTRDDQGKVTYDNGDGDGPDTDPTDPATPNRSDISHGTHVSGIIAATWGNFTPPCTTCSGSGVAGASYIAPVKVLPIRVLDAPAGNGSESDIATAIVYAAGDPVTLSDGKTYTNSHPAQVINMSLGGPLSNQTQIKVLCDAVARATTLGSLVVAAGGNFAGTALVYPAACPGAVSVASVSLSGSAVPLHAYYSDQYEQVALSAPGGQPGTYYNGGTLNNQPLPDEIISTGWNYAQNLPGYYLEAGTSQAAPQVSVLAALLLSKGVAATPAAALDRMLKTASDLGTAGRDSTYGVGLINPAAALGAPAVSNALGLSVQDAQGRTYVPTLDSVGRFTAYLPDGGFRVVAGRDSNGNGFAGEAGEPRAEKSVTFGPSQPSFDVGILTP